MEGRSQRLEKEAIKLKKSQAIFYSLPLEMIG